jgi:hypothetical protein
MLRILHWVFLRLWDFSSFEGRFLLYGARPGAEVSTLNLSWKSCRGSQGLPKLLLCLSSNWFQMKLISFLTFSIWSQIWMSVLQSIQYDLKRVNSLLTKFYVWITLSYVYSHQIFFLVVFITPLNFPKFQVWIDFNFPNKIQFFLWISFAVSLSNERIFFHQLMWEVISLSGSVTSISSSTWLQYICSCLENPSLKDSFSINI